jgi:hypothetical protein
MELKNELVVVIGYNRSSYIEKNINNYQLIDEYVLSEAIRKEQLPNDPKFLYSLMAVITRMYMIIGLPIIVDSQSFELESIFLWKQFTVMYNYRLKLIILFPEKERSYLNDLEKISLSKFNELVSILKMKHHRMYDDIQYTEPTTEEK